ncbi:MAG TPA: LptA/OstA family protein, partial [Candidatus Binatia bacterium]
MQVRKTPVFISLILALALLPAAPLFAAQAGRAGEQKPEEEIRLKADSMSVSSQGSQIEGQGNVEIQRDEMTIKADQVWLNRETQDMEATGKVVVDDPEWKIKQADRLRFNLGDETGTIENGDLFLE